MIKRPTWILLGVLVLAVGAYFMIKKLPSNASKGSATATSAPYLLPSGTLQSLQVKDSNGKNFRMQRDTANNWVITSPRNGAADQALATAAETQAGALQILNTLEVPGDLSVFQLNKPADTINVAFTNGDEHRIDVGGMTPTSSGYYVRLDGSKVYVVSKSGIDSLLNLLAAPPFPATPTPAESPTPAAGAATATP